MRPAKKVVGPSYYSVVLLLLLRRAADGGRAPSESEWPDERQGTSAKPRECGSKTMMADRGRLDQHIMNNINFFCSSVVLYARCCPVKRMASAAAGCSETSQALARTTYYYNMGPKSTCRSLKSRRGRATWW